MFSISSLFLISASLGGPPQSLVLSFFGVMSLLLGAVDEDASGGGSSSRGRFSPVGVVWGEGAGFGGSTGSTLLFDALRFVGEVGFGFALAFPLGDFGV
jgi:hypothetical protein